MPTRQDIGLLSRDGGLQNRSGLSPHNTVVAYHHLADELEMSIQSLHDEAVLYRARSNPQVICWDRSSGLAQACVDGTIEDTCSLIEEQGLYMRRVEELLQFQGLLARHKSEEPAGVCGGEGPAEAHRCGLALRVFQRFHGLQVDLDLALLAI